MNFKEMFQQKYDSQKIMKMFKESKNKYVDNRFWKPVLDPKTGSGGAVIRFLPSQHHEKVDVRIFEYSFQGPTGLWYIEKCLNSVGLPDPVTDYNSALWVDENLRDDVRKRKRKVAYISNIFVVKDPANPENNGKVFLYKYGKKIYDHICNAMAPDDQKLEENVEEFDPFNIYTAPNFILKISRGQGGFPNYDKSRFDLSSRGPISEDDEEMRRIYNSTYSLDEFLDLATYKSYDQLKQKFCTVMSISLEEFDRVVNKKKVVISNTPTTKVAEENEEEETLVVEEKKKSSPSKSSKKPTKKVEKEEESDDEDDEIFEFLNKLDAEDDDLVPF